MKSRSDYKWYGILVGVIFVAGLAVWAHEGHKPLPTRGARVEGDTIFLSLDARKALGMATAQVDLRDLERTLTATASVVAPWKHHAFATTRVGGKLEQIFVRPGDFIKEGQKLAEIDSLELANHQLELIQSKLELELAQQTLDRAESLGMRGIVSERDVRAAQATKLEKTTQFQVLQRKLIGLGLTEATLQEVLRTEQPVRTLPIHSPARGVVVHGDANPGRIVEPAEHLFEILDLSTVWVKAMVVEAEAYRVEPNQPVRVALTSLPNDVRKGGIDYMALRVDPTQRAIPVWTSLTNADATNPAIRPGMFGRVEIVTDRIEQAVACPSAALVTAGAESYVFVQRKQPTKDRPGEYVKRNVVLGLQTRDWIEVKQGLFPGDEVVTLGSHELSAFFVQGVLALTLEAQRNIKLRLEPVEQRPVDDVVSVNGTVEMPPEHKAFASPRIAGRINRILVDLGEQVQAGQVLAEIESLEFQNLQLELVQTQTRLAQLADLLERARQLKTAIPQQEVLQREMESRKAENELSAAKRKLQTVGLTAADVAAIMEEGKLLETLPVRAPIDGFVVNLNLMPGQVVKAEDSLFEVHDMSKVWVRGHVFEKDMAKVQLGQPVRIRLVSDPHYMAEARLVRTNFVLSAAERVLSVWAELDNPGRRLKENMLARLTIATGASRAVSAVPADAVLSEGSDAYVFVKDPVRANYFERRAVRLGRRDDRFVEIRSGLVPGEVVAIGGVHELRTAYAAIR